MLSLKQYLAESPTSDAAKVMGLSYFGFGKYGKNGKVTHVVRFGRLTPVHKVANIDTSGSKLKHLEHIEDEVFNNGVHGVRHSLHALHAIKDYFKHKGNDIKLNQKVDGAPSTIISVEKGKKPYVSTKSAFNATPKLNYSHEDIEKHHPGEGLQQKLKVALDHLPKVVKGGTFQGDLLYTHHDIKVMNIDGKAHYVFKPNTITYAVPVNSDLGKRVAKSKVGIVIHTQYDEKGKANFDPDMSKFTHDNPDALVLSNDMANGLVDITPEEEHKFNKLLSNAGAHFQKVEKESWDVIKHEKIAPFFKTYINSKVREGDLKLSSADFEKFILSKFEKEMAGLKSEKGKEGRRATQRAILEDLEKQKPHIDKLFRLHKSITDTKDHLIQMMNKHQIMKSFLEAEGDTLEPVEPEGYVVTTDSGALKLVNRLGFSAANFRASAHGK